MLENKRTGLLIIILMIIIIVLSLYIVYDKYLEIQKSVQEQSFLAGYNQGIKDSVLTLIQNSRNCQPVSVVYGNITTWLIDINCTLFNLPSNNSSV